jgi:hypothetical protein
MPQHRAIHLARLGTAAALSLLSSAIMVWLVRRWSFFDSMTLLVIPLAVLLGMAPIIYWYRRDAYPIGLFYGVSMFLVLRWVFGLMRIDY